MKTVTKWRGGLAFEGQNEQHTVAIDTTVAGGGSDTGMSPKRLLLNALSACSGMDVVTILEKMKIKYSLLEIEAEAEQTDEDPKVFKEIFVTYKIDASQDDDAKVKRAVELSQDKYCGIAAMLRKHCAIHHKVEYV
ncbi:MAG: OsmC family protein [Segetibacter sp.]|nr:OsmC family protein [Segetibacter sp.]